MTDTTRRYPRTSSEAFKGPDYASAIERPARGYGAAWWLALALCAVAGLALVAGSL